MGIVIILKVAEYKMSSIDFNKKNKQKTLLIGTGEYTTGWTDQGAVKSDKSCGVVGLVFFDLRNRKKISKQIKICGTNSKKFFDIRNHLKSNIENIYGLTTTF